MDKEYLGDSVYVQGDRELIVLTTDNGEGSTNIIFLNTEVQAALFRYLERLK